ncbi:MAG: hypothetical protein PF637_11975 [Spirochaetes bacterium]|jgi:hypothetical protein|nr:hypothetical protein [Spirochaetota bacterium]
MSRELRERADIVSRELKELLRPISQEIRVRNMERTDAVSIRGYSGLRSGDR